MHWSEDCRALLEHMRCLLTPCTLPLSRYERLGSAQVDIATVITSIVITYLTPIGDTITQ